jgi:hypothetical protein
MELMNLIINNKEFSALIISLLALIIPLWQYLNSKKQEQRQINLINFHEKIIRKISNRDPNANIGLEEQVAVIFELRNFPEYSPVIVRMLTDCIVRWEEEIIKYPHYKSLIAEAKETMNFFSRNFISRFFNKLYYHYF